jgi:hypothetical protein
MPSKNRKDWSGKITCKNLGFTWILLLAFDVFAEDVGIGAIGQAGSSICTLASSEYSFVAGNIPAHVFLILKRQALVFSSTCKSYAFRI